MTSRLRRYAVVVCAAVLALGAAMSVHGQTPPNTKSLRDQLRARYDVVALRDGVGLVPHQREGDVRLIEIRNGGVAINGNTISALEVRQQLGQDADLILRLTYLDAAAQRDLARADSTTTAPQVDTGETTNEPEPSSPARTQTHNGDRVHIGGGVTVGRDEIVEGDAVAIGGSADIDGEVTGDVAAIGGPLTLGPEAVVRGDAVAVGGPLNRSPGARVSGKVTVVGVGAQFPMQFPLNRPFRRDFSFWRPFSQVGGLLAALLRATFLILGALVVVALGGRFVEAVADRSASEPLRAGLAGLLTEILFVPLLIITIVVLAVSIVGIPLLILVPFGMVLAVVLMFVGFTGVACQVGRLVSNRFGIKRGPYVSVALGVVVVVGITLVARIIALAGGFVFGLIVAGPLTAIGYLAEYVAWTIGIGAVILTWLGSRQRVAPTPAGAAPAVAGEAHGE